MSNQQKKQRPGRKPERLAITGAFMRTSYTDPKLVARLHEHLQKGPLPEVGQFDPVTVKACEIIMATVNAKPTTTQHVVVDLGVQALISSILLIDLVVQLGRDIKISTMNAITAFYGTLFGMPSVAVEFLGNRLDRRNGLLIPADDANGKQHAQAIRNANFVLMGAYHISAGIGICGSPEFDAVRAQRKAQILSGRVIIIPCKWAKLTDVQGIIFLPKEDLKKHASKIQLVTQDPENLDNGPQNADVELYLKRISELEKLGVTVHRLPASKTKVEKPGEKK